MILCDTNILIEFYKKNALIMAELQRIGVHRLAISVITEAELYYGALNRAELARIQKHLSGIVVLPLNRQISANFIDLLARYCLSHHLAIPDALIAATAITHDIQLYTINLRDFRFIEELRLYQPEGSTS